MSASKIFNADQVALRFKIRSGDRVMWLVRHRQFPTPDIESLHVPHWSEETLARFEQKQAAATSRQRRESEAKVARALARFDETLRPKEQESDDGEP